MIPTRASSRLDSTTSLMTLLKSVAIPVDWTTPMMIPTQALAAIRATPFLAALTSASRMDGLSLGCSRANSSSPNMPTRQELMSDSA